MLSGWHTGTRRSSGSRGIPASCGDPAGSANPRRNRKHINSGFAGFADGRGPAFVLQPRWRSSTWRREEEEVGRSGRGLLGWANRKPDCTDSVAATGGKYLRTSQAAATADLFLGGVAKLSLVKKKVLQCRAEIFYSCWSSPRLPDLQNIFRYLRSNVKPPLIKALRG